MLHLLVVLVFSFIMYDSIISHVWSSESLPIWERAAESVHHLSDLFMDVTLCCDTFPLYIVGGVWDLAVSVLDRYPL